MSLRSNPGIDRKTGGSAHLLDRGHLGRRLGAMLRRDGDQLDASSFQQRQRRAESGKHPVEIAVRDRRVDLRLVLVRHENHLRARAVFEIGASEVRRAADIRRAIGQLARVGFRGRDERPHRRIGPVGFHRDEKRRAVDHPHRHEVLLRVVGQLLVQRRVDRHVRVADDEQLVAVGRRVFPRLDGDEAARTGPGVDDHLLAPGFRELVAHDAHEYRGARTARIGREDLHHFRRIARLRRLGERGRHSAEPRRGENDQARRRLALHGCLLPGAQTRCGQSVCHPRRLSG